MKKKNQFFKFNNCLKLNDDQKVLLSKDLDFKQSLQKIASNLSVEWELRKNVLKVFSENRNKIEQILKNYKFLKVVKNGEELPGIIDYFSLFSFDTNCFFYKKFLDDKQKSKVHIFIKAKNKNDFIKAKKFEKDLRSFYFSQEILITHKKDIKFQLGNRQENEIFSQYSYAANQFLSKKIKNECFLIDKKLNYFFIENRNTKFGSRILFYWPIKERRSIIREIIRKIKEKIGQYKFFCLF